MSDTHDPYKASLEERKLYCISESDTYPYIAFSILGGKTTGPILIPVEGTKAEVLENAKAQIENNIEDSENWELDDGVNFLDTPGLHGRMNCSALPSAEHILNAISRILDNEEFGAKRYLSADNVAASIDTHTLER